MDSNYYKNKILKYTNYIAKCKFHIQWIYLFSNLVNYLGFVLLCNISDNDHKKMSWFHSNDNIEWHWMQLELNWNFNWFKLIWV
jgi:hypothetical protein